MKNLLPTLLAIILTVIIFTGCKPVTGSDCGLFYGDSLELRVGQKVYSCDSSWICLDSVIVDSLMASDTSFALDIVLTYEIQGGVCHEHFSTVDTWVEEMNFAGYSFLLQEISRGFSVNSYYLKVYEIYPQTSISVTPIDQLNYCLYCVFVRDIEG